MVNPSSTCNDYINKNKNFKILKTIFYFESRLIIKKKKKKTKFDYKLSCILTLQLHSISFYRM